MWVTWVLSKYKFWFNGVVSEKSQGMLMLGLQTMYMDVCGITPIYIYTESHEFIRSKSMSFLKYNRIKDLNTIPYVLTIDHFSLTTNGKIQTKESAKKKIEIIFLCLFFQEMWGHYLLDWLHAVGDRKKTLT